MMIIDSQIHIWRAQSAARPWIAGAQDRPPYSDEEALALMDKSGVQGAILVPPSFEGHRNDYALEAAKKYPQRFAVMGRFEIQNQSLAGQLSTWKSQPGMLGIRLTFHRDKDRPWLTDGSTDWFWPLAQEHQIPLMVHAPERLPEMAAIAKRYPKLKVIIDHMGFARSTMDEHAQEGAKRVIALADLDNVFVKISALPCYSSEAYPYRNLHQPVKTVIDAFGADRSFWGTDITRMPKSSRYQEAVAMMTQVLDFLSPKDLESVMGRGLADCLGWKLSA